ncbi:MAG: methionine synthase [Thermoplasmata archaeon]|nr:MAG: methionine synthase [Thermoplasmata archaeon]
MNSDLACLATGVGSLPHASPDRAYDLILQNLKEIPFWPQLSNLAFKENMYAQFSYLLPNVVIDEENKRVYLDTSKDPGTAEDFLAQIIEENVDHFKYDQEYFHGLFGMLEKKENLKDIMLFKGQITGPISLGFQVTDEDRKPIYYNDFYRDLMVKNLKMMARWQEKTLKQLCDRTMIFLDEPYLSMVGSAFVSIQRENAIEHMNEVLSGIEGIKAIHCCANTDWSLVLDTDIEVLNFDAYEYADNLFLYSDKVIEFLERGGIIAWGIVPTNEEDLEKESVDSLTKRLENNIMTLAEKGISKDVILRSSIITPSCGLGPTTVKAAERALPVLREVSIRMREKHGFL